MADLPKRPLGEAGLEVSIIGVGGYHDAKDALRRNGANVAADGSREKYKTG